MITVTMQQALDFRKAYNFFNSIKLPLKAAYKLTKIKNAGAIFLGEYSSEPLGDYFAGPNHILPTNRTARFFSPLSVDDFVKKTSIISYSQEGLYKVHKDIELFAKEEGLTAHANSIAVRFENCK